MRGIHFFLLNAKNSDMETFLIIFAVIIVFITLMITINIQINYDILLNVGNIKIKIFKYIPIISSNITIIGDYLNFSNKKAKVIKIKLDINDFSIQFFNEFSSYIKQKILPLKLVTNGQICLENAFAVSIASAFLKLLTTIILMKLQLTYQDLDVENNIISGYRHNILTVNFEFAFAIAIYDLIWSIIRSLIVIRRKHEKRKHNKQPQQSYTWFNY